MLTLCMHNRILYLYIWL